jgi:hypothetical protein
MNNNIVRVGLAAAAVVVIAIIAINLLPGSPTPGGDPSVSPSVEPSEAPPSSAPSEAAASVPADIALPEGPFTWFEPPALPDPHNDGPGITVTIPASGWVCPQGVFAACIIAKGDTIETILDQTSMMESDPPLNVPLESALIARSTTAGIHVFDDPCQWEYPLPGEPPATTAAAIAAALAAQPGRDASVPEDVTVGGYPGKVVTLHVPDDAVFADCFRGVYASYTLEGFGDVPARWHQGPGQIDTFWIAEVDDAIVIIDAMYRADTPAERIEEMRSIAESATFE